LYFPRVTRGVGEAREKDEVARHDREEPCCRSFREENQYSNTDSARDVVDFIGDVVDVVRLFLSCRFLSHSYISYTSYPQRYGECSKGRVMEVHQELKTRGFLTRWQDAPSDSEIIFVSHEWLSWAHPDPKGEQLRVLCRVLEKLKSGELNTEMDPIHTILYKHKFTTKGKDWKAMLKRTYLWVDWFSMPQPGAEKEDEIGEERMAKLRAEGSRAIRSIPAYVERSDFIMILVPSLYHSDREVPTCYRTWRRRGWCLLELYAAALARDSSNPPLLVRSERGTPMWMSPMEVMKLSIGLADFTCCQRNHVITTETQKVMSGGQVKKIPCDKPIAGGILEQLINAKINHLYNAEGDLVMARLHYVLKHWWMRELKEQGRFITDNNKSAVEKFKKKLKWQDDEKWFDCDGVGVLFYAVVSDEPHVVRELLRELKQNFKGVEYTRRLESLVRDEGYVALGIPGRMTALLAAMVFASAQIICLLLEYDADLKSVDVMGNNALLLASAMGRTNNVKCWLEKMERCDLETRNALMTAGLTSLHASVYVGAVKFDTTKTLLEAGADMTSHAFTGENVLHFAVENEDSDPDVIRLLLQKLSTGDINSQSRANSVVWRGIRFVAKALYRAGIAKEGLFGYLAMDAGTTSLNKAVVRGDVEIVKLLLKAGADPYVENDLGMNAFEICNKCGPFPSVMKALQKNSE